jgi:hypothetical protein
MTPTLEMLERFRAGSYRDQTKVVEHKPPTELVAPFDFLRTDSLGRRVVACPAGQPPPSWLQLTEQERHALVEPTPPSPDGWLEPGHAGFTPRNIRVGYTIEPG